MTEVYVYVFDLFVPTDLTKKEVMKAFEKDILKPFELVREIVEDKLKGIKNVELYNAFFKDDEFVLEYAVDFANGRINVRIIGSENPYRFFSE